MKEPTELEKKRAAVIAAILIASENWKGEFLTREDLKTFSGNSFSVGHLANLDSRGEGPSGSFYFGRKRVYTKTAVAEWLISRVEV